MKMWFILLIFLVGIGIGLGAPSVAPKYLGSYFPKGLTAKRSGVHGTVVKKQVDQDRLLLTISAPDGALLATFEKNLTEVALLVDQGDSITLDVHVYAPFVKDPPILRVKKPDEVMISHSEPDQGESESEDLPTPTPSISSEKPTPNSEESDLSTSSTESDSKAEPFF